MAWEQQREDERDPDASEAHNLMADIRVELKICEACGALGLRPVTSLNAYCAQCSNKLGAVVTPVHRTSPGRAPRMAVA